MKNNVSAIISHKNKYIYSYIPKAACTTIRRLLANKEGIKWHPNWSVKNGKILKTSFKTIKKAEITKYEDYKYFTFVRNPWSRLVSCYFDKVVSVRTMPDSKFVFKGIYKRFRKRYKGVRFDRMSFIDFANFVVSHREEESDGHFRSQHTFLILDRLDFIGKVENLFIDFDKIFGDNSCDKQYSEWSTKHKHYTEYYNRTIEDQIGERYKEDINIFNYTFGDKK